jgi:hypothetical protein
MTLYLEKLKTALANSDVAFVLLNPKDYTDHVMLNMTKETYEPCTRREELLRGLVGVYTSPERRSPFCSVYVRREVSRGEIVCGKEGDNPLESLVPRGFVEIGRP